VREEGMFFQTRKPSHGGRGGSIFSGKKTLFCERPAE